MDPVTASALAAGGTGLFGYFSQRSTNAANRAEAKRNRQFQGKMRGTQWQATVADMEAAGINPAVAYSRGASSGLGGSQATMVDPVSNMSSALQVREHGKQMKLLDAQIDKVLAEGRQAHAGAQMAWNQYQFDNMKYSYYFDGSGRPTGALRELLKSEHVRKIAGSAEDVARASIMQFSVPEQKAIAQLFEQAGAAGKGTQYLLPLLQTILRGPSSRPRR